MTEAQQTEADEVWKIDFAEVVEIYADRVEIDGQEISMGVEEAKAKVRDQPQFNQVN